MSLNLGLRNKIMRSRAGGFTPLLDQSFASGATAAYSLRKLKSTATKAVRVREDSGNTEADIGFSNGTLDETALLNHCGSNNGFVTKWYDQSGNGNDASNSAATSQPQIVNSGSVIKVNNLPALSFDGADFLQTGAFLLSQPISEFVVSKINASADLFIAHTIRSSDNANKRVQVNSLNNEFQLFAGNVVNFQPADKKQNAFSIIYNSSNSEVYTNEVQKASGVNIGNNNLGDKLQIGTQQTGTANLFGLLQEDIIYGDKLASSDRANIDSNVNNFWR